VVTGTFLRVWRPRRIWRYETRHVQEGSAEAADLIRQHTIPLMPLKQAIAAWMPFIVLCFLMVAVGMNKKTLDALSLGPLRGQYELHLRGLDKQVERMPPDPFTLMVPH
jgi:L-lactate permease